MPKTRVLHVRVDPTELAVWRVAAAVRGRTLSELVRELLAGAAADGVTPKGEGPGSSLSPRTSLARATESVAPTLEERLTAIGELVAAHGVARPLPHAAEGQAEIEATSGPAPRSTD